MPRCRDGSQASRHRTPSTQRDGGSTVRRRAMRTRCHGAQRRRCNRRSPHLIGATSGQRRSRPTQRPRPQPRCTRSVADSHSLAQAIVATPRPARRSSVRHLPHAVVGSSRAHRSTVAARAPDCPTRSTPRGRSAPLLAVAVCVLAPNARHRRSLRHIARPGVLTRAPIGSSGAADKRRRVRSGSQHHGVFDSGTLDHAISHPIGEALRPSLARGMKADLLVEVSRSLCIARRPQEHFAGVLI
jgi:hypothetical protein